MNKRLLIIAYHYPPSNASSGAQRTLKFSTYLLGHGWEPMILSISPRAYGSVNYDQMNDIPNNIVVERAFGLDTSRHLAVGGRYPRLLAQPDRWISWWPAAVWRGMRMIRRLQPAAIMSTFPIATAHLIGLTLQQLSGLPWLADFRDSMTEENYPADPLTWSIHRRLEKTVVNHSSRVIFTTDGARRMYAERYPDVPQDRWRIIENGFDEENFVEAEAGFSRSSMDGLDQVTLLHSGIVYPEERDPCPFFRALRSLKDIGEVSPANLRVVLRASGHENLYQPILSEYGLQDMVLLLPTLGYRDALREMISADGLLVLQGSSCNHQIPAKIYEYFRSGRPIFAMTDPNGDTAEALRSSGIKDIVDMADEEGIAKALSGFISNLRKGSLCGVERSIAAMHSRRARTSELARLLDELDSKQS